MTTEDGKATDLTRKTPEAPALTTEDVRTTDGRTEEVHTTAARIPKRTATGTDLAADDKLIAH